MRYEGAACAYKFVCLFVRTHLLFHPGRQTDIQTDRQALARGRAAKEVQTDTRCRVRTHAGGHKHVRSGGGTHEAPSGHVDWKVYAHLYLIHICISIL